MHKHFVRAIVLILPLFFPSFLQAESLFQDTLEERTLVLRAAAGGAWVSAGNTSLQVTDIERDRLEFDTAGAPIASLGMGYIFPLNYRFWEVWRWFPTIKASFDVTEQFEASLDGTVFLFGDHDYPDYVSKTDINSTTFMANLTLDILEYKKTSIFIIGGIGAAWTNISYEETPAPHVDERGNITLDRHSSVTFAVQVGGGVAYELLPDLDMSLTYLFTDLGSPETSDIGKINAVPYPDVESTNINLTQQLLLLGLEYAF